MSVRFRSLNVQTYSLVNRSGSTEPVWTKVNGYRCLGVHVSEDLTWMTHQRLNHLHRLRKLEVFTATTAEILLHRYSRLCGLWKHQCLVQHLQPSGEESSSQRDLQHCSACRTSTPGTEGPRQTRLLRTFTTPIKKCFSVCPLARVSAPSWSRRRGWEGASSPRLPPTHKPPWHTSCTSFVHCIFCTSAPSQGNCLFLKTRGKNSFILQDLISLIVSTVFWREFQRPKVAQRVKRTLWWKCCQWGITELCPVDERVLAA